MDEDIAINQPWLLFKNIQVNLNLFLCFRYTSSVKYDTPNNLDRLSI